jgi:hypothetical protein
MNLFLRANKLCRVRVEASWLVQSHGESKQKRPQV